MDIKGGDFYSTPEGAVNAMIIAKNSATLSDELIRKYGHYGTGLIMGYGDGWLIEYFRNKFSRLLIVEGSETLAASAARKYHNYPHITCHHSYFESFELPMSQQADIILANHVLEHVDNPIEVLLKAKSWLKDTGRAIFSVPNADSLHRRIGVKMKMLKTRFDLNDQDRLVGHKRVYDQTSLSRDIIKGGYKIIELGGFNLKLVSQKQMKDWSEELIQAIFEVSRECPRDMCSNLYAVCQPQKM